MIAGKCLMDRNVPNFLAHTAEQGIRDSEYLLHCRHGKSRQRFAVTVRFAPTSSPSRLQVAGELAVAYRRNHPDARRFYQATLGGARALGTEGIIGNVAPVCEADFIVPDPQATPLLACRSARCRNLEERLFALAMLADERAIAAAYATGHCVHRRA